MSQDPSSNGQPLRADADTRRRAKCTHHRIIVCERGDERRPELERFVHDVFVAQHSAHVCSFMPTLLALRSDAGHLCGVAGYRCAAEEPLFLERYLDQPIESAIHSVTGRSAQRSQIVEVGNLAGASCRAAVRLVLALPQLLLSRGQLWVAFTATDVVRQLLSSYGAPLFELAPAQADRVAALGDDWGRYYRADPRVMVGFLPDGLALRRARQVTP
jgi:hypothetical protein